jgi:hypothetical protein
MLKNVVGITVSQSMMEKRSVLYSLSISPFLLEQFLCKRECFHQVLLTIDFPLRDVTVAEPAWDDKFGALGAETTFGVP